MKIRTISLLLIISLIFTGFTPLELKENSKGYLLMDAETKEVFCEYNVDEVIPIASTSKLMSYILFREALDSGIWNKDTLLIATKADIRSGSVYKIKVGESYTVEELMKASLIISANDATALLARNLAGSEEAFANLMNNKAKELNLSTAKFYNSTGLPIYPKNIQNHMSIRDLSKLSLYILEQYPDILNITSTTEIMDIEGKEMIKNTNPLLDEDYGIEGADGLKTGTTNKAGSCLIWTLTTKGDKPTRLLGINMGFETGEMRNEAVKNFAKYAKDNYSLNSWVSRDKPIYLFVKESKEKFIPLYPMDDFTDRSINNYEYSISIKDFKLPIKKGEIIGNIAIIKKGETVFTTDLIALEEFKKKGLF